MPIECILYLSCTFQSESMHSLENITESFRLSNIQISVACIITHLILAKTGENCFKNVIHVYSQEVKMMIIC